MKKLLSCLFAVALTAAVPGAMAQAFPNKPVRIIVGFGPGTLDAMTRLVALKLADRLGQPVIVENKPGANGSIAAEFVAKSAPDGYTLLSTGSGAHVLNAVVRKNLRYDTEKAFTPLVMMMRIPMVMSVSPALPAKTVKEFVDHVKTNKLKISYGSTGVASSLHLAGLMLQDTADLDAVHTPYSSESQALYEVIAGRSTYIFAGMGSAAPRIRDGSVKGLAITGPARSKVLPDIPTMVESGFPYVNLVNWYGFVTPAGVPQAVAARLEAEMLQVLNDPEIIERARALGSESAALGRDEFGKMVTSDFKRLGDLVTKANLKVE